MPGVVGVVRVGTVQLHLWIRRAKEDANMFQRHRMRGTGGYNTALRQRAVSPVVGMGRLGRLQHVLRSGRRYANATMSERRGLRPGTDVRIPPRRRRPLSYLEHVGLLVRMFRVVWRRPAIPHPPMPLWNQLSRYGISEFFCEDGYGIVLYIVTC